MKILSIAVPCYNSSAYMKHCIDSLLSAGEAVEIIIVNDGSTDDTGAIADEYALKYPSIIKVIHQENGGHGEGVNAGLRAATGYYYKVVDSDDWVDVKAFAKVIETLRQMIEDDENLDLLICNYVYDKVGARRKKVINYRMTLPKDQIFTWDDIRHFKLGQYLLMHSVIFKTQLLRDCGLELPKHTFYVDNIFVFKPLPYAKKIFYLDVNLYRYFIGRDDQSVNEEVMTRRIDQQIYVNKIMFNYFDENAIESPKLRRYMFNYLSIITTVSSVLLIKSKTPENLNKKQELWEYFKHTKPKVYRKLRHHILGIFMNFPGKIGRQTAITAYKISQLLFRFN